MGWVVEGMDLGRTSYVSVPCNWTLNVYPLVVEGYRGGISKSQCVQVLIVWR